MKNKLSFQDVVTIRNSLLKSILIWIICALGGALVLGMPARAQVTGVFFPSAVGEIQEPGVTPYPQVGAPDLSLEKKQMLQLESEAKLLHSPYINFGSAYANQSLIPRVGQMDSFTPEILEVGYFPTLQSEAKFSYIPTLFGTAGLKAPRVFGQEFRGTYRIQPTNRLKLAGQLGIYDWTKTEQVDGGINVLGAASGTYAINDRLHMTVGFRRDILGNSLLSTSGLNLPFTKDLVGRVSQNLFFGVITLRPTPQSYVSALYGGGVDTGTRVQANPFQTVGLSAGRSLYDRDPHRLVSHVGLNYQFLVSSWKYDLNNIGNASLQIQQESPSTTAAIVQSSKLGQTQVPGVATPSAGGFFVSSAPSSSSGVGGYFSPQVFMINSLGFSAAGRLLPAAYWRGGVGCAIGSSQTPTSNLGQVSFGGFANASITTRIRRNVIMEQGWFFLQGATSYRRNVLYSQCRYFIGKSN